MLRRVPKCEVYPTLDLKFEVGTFSSLETLSRGMYKGEKNANFYIHGHIGYQGNHPKELCKRKRRAARKIKILS